MVTKATSTAIEISPIRKMTEECERLGGINLGQGLCTTPTPRAAVIAANKAMHNGHNSYVSAQGINDLRKAISVKLADFNRIEADPNTEIMVTSGATGAFVAAVSATCSVGDAIALIEPYYGYHRLAAEQLSVEVCSLGLGPNIEFNEETASRIARSGRLKAIVVCTPSNPSSKVYTRQEIEVIVEWAAARNIWIITDETYEYYVYDNKVHISPGSLEKSYRKIISIFSFSKTFSVPGWRLGYLVCPASLMPKLLMVHDRLFICAPTAGQYGGIAALQDIGSSYFRSLVRTFELRRNILFETVSSTAMRPLKPEGAYYLWANVAKLGFDTSPRARERSLSF